MQAPIHTPDESATALGAFFCLLWLFILIGWLVGKSHAIAETVAWFRRKAVPAKIFIVCAFCAVLTYGSIKGGGNAPQGLPRPPLLLQVVEPPPEPAIAPVSVWTNGVALRAESTNSVEITAFRTVGGSELGDWIETAAPFFAIGTNPVNRCFVSASGSVSFESMRRPPVGSALPDGTGLPVLCPLRAPLGMVPEARWAMVFGQDEQDCHDEQDSPASGDGSVPVNPENPVNPVKGSRFWHDILPGGGRVLTWENALVDRLPGRRVSLQVEMRPMGDGVFRYSFQDELAPPPTNFVMGAQMGTNGVNALSILGTNTLAATVWNVEGEPVTNGVSIADLLCTNGVLRTPATFEIRWKNTTGLDPEADSDNDGLTDWAETFVWGTAPDHADTDADGTADNVELMMGADPFDADEDGDGVPDGMSAENWATNSLWSANAPEGSSTITITLNRAVPSGSSATLVVGNLCIPLRSPSSWTLGLVPGQFYPFRLVSRNAEAVALSIDAAAPPVLRRGAPSAPEPSGDPLWVDDPSGVFDGAANRGTGLLAVLTLSLVGEHDGEDECVHDGDSSVTRFYTLHIEPDIGLTLHDLHVENFDIVDDMTASLTLEGYYPSTVTGTVSLFPPLIRSGFTSASRTLHRCLGAANYNDCNACGFAHPSDYSCSHEPDCAAVLDPAADCTCDLWLQVAWQDADGNGIEDRFDTNLVAGSETIDFSAIGSTFYSCCCGIDSGEDGPLSARLHSHSPNLRIWDAGGTLLHPGDDIGTFAIQATAPSPSVDGSEVVYRIFGPTNDVRRTIRIHVTAWDVWCTGLSFNSVTNAHAIDAINLRHGYATNLVIDYTLPEWEAPANHAAAPTRNEPACWIGGTWPEIQARFEIQPSDITNAVLRADHDGSILADVLSTAVAFSNGVTRAAAGTTNWTDFAAFSPFLPVLPVVSRSTNEVWTWRANSLNGHAVGGALVATNGPSVAYSILGEPVAPWTDAVLTNQNVWTSALDFVITNACEGATTETNALAELTQFLFSGHGLVYETDFGKSKYYESVFTNGIRRVHYFLSDYLTRGRGEYVNCYDQAYGLSLLGRTMGISSDVIFLLPFGYINKTDLVGIQDCNNPFFTTNHVPVESKLLGVDDIDRNPFFNHRYVDCSGFVFDACAGPALGTQTHDEYLLATVDTSTTNEFHLTKFQHHPLVAGKTAGDAANEKTDHYPIEIY